MILCLCFCVCCVLKKIVNSLIISVFMSKYQAEDSLSISIYFLNKKNKLKETNLDIIAWDYLSSGKRVSVGYFLDIENKYIQLMYDTTDYKTGKKVEVNQKYRLITTPCYFGGERYWFVCCNCGRQVAKLYSTVNHNLFLCRYCLGLTYQSRIQGYAYVVGDIDKYYDNEVKRKYYKGKKTRKYLIYLRKIESLKKTALKFEVGLDIIIK